MMKKKLSILVAMMLVMTMSVSTSLAVYENDGSIGFPGGNFSMHNEISDNKKDSFVGATGTTGVSLSVTATFYYVDTVTGNLYSTSQNGSISLPADSEEEPTLRKNAPTLGSDYNYFRVKSFLEGSIGINSGSLSISATAYGNEP